MVANRPKAAVLAKKKLLTSLGQETSYEFTQSPDGTHQAAVFMHSRMGLRIEFNIHRCTLEIWVSPQAGKSVDYRDRNFSCRDDHTTLFDRISFPELSAKRFKSCTYDAFHSILHFEGQDLHIATLLDEPAVLVWAESEEVVDLKSDKQDTIRKRTPRVLGVRHPDRGKVLDFYAALGKGRATFLHQPEVDLWRSTYARVVLAPRQLLVLGGELSKERVGAMVARVAGRPIGTTLADNERRIARALEPGTVAIKGSPDMQKLYDANKRHLLSAQDASGAIRAALKYVYYLIWTTDGSVTSTHMFQTGWRDFLTHWLEFLLANPTTQQSPPRGRFYGQLTNGRITKREEFGSLCAVWAAYMHFGLTGDRRFVSGEYLKVLEDAVAWLDRYCFDPKLGALGTFYFGGGSEDPFYGSNDFGWDAAVGCPMNRDCYAPRFDGQIILRGYEFGMNLNHYNMYRMLADVTGGRRSAAYDRKAKVIEAFLCRLLKENARAYYLLDGKGLTPAPRAAGDQEMGYLAVQSQSPAFFMPEFAALFTNRMRSFSRLTTESVRGKMPSGVYGRLAALDTEFVDAEQVFASLEATLVYHTRPTRLMPMAYTMVEILGLDPEDYHDIRPQAFSAGPFQAAVTNLAVRTMPFGVALRATDHISELRQFEYRNGHLDIRYTGKGRIRRILLNGRPMQHTLQVPDNRLTGGANSVLVELSAEAADGPMLVYSTVELADVERGAAGITYRLVGHGQCVLAFRGIRGEVIVRDSKGRPVAAKHEQRDGHLFVEFEGRGAYTGHVAAE